MVRSSHLASAKVIETYKQQIKVINLFSVLLVFDPTKQKKTCKYCTKAILTRKNILECRNRSISMQNKRKKKHIKNISQQKSQKHNSFFAFISLRRKQSKHIHKLTGKIINHSWLTISTARRWQKNKQHNTHNVAGCWWLLRLRIPKGTVWL